MALLTYKTFAANGDTDLFQLGDSGVTVFIGDSGGATFGGGTVSIKYTHNGTDFATDSTTYASASVVNLSPMGSGMQCKLTLAGATSPDLNITVLS